MALGIHKSNNSHNQTLRWKSVMSQWQKAHKENKEIIVLTDDNMDYNNNTFNNNYKINNIKEITTEFLNNNNYTTINDTNTYHIKQKSISCIDHIYSNCPHKITHVTTHNTGQSDHSILTARYHTKAPITPRRQFFTRKKYKLTAHALNQHLQHNNVIHSAFSYTDPNLVADIIMSEYNNLIEIIAPSTIKQVNKNYTPYI